VEEGREGVAQDGAGGCRRVVVERDYGQQLVEVMVTGLLLERGGRGDARVHVADPKLLVFDLPLRL
jgi:hypothetical protein